MGEIVMHGHPYDTTALGRDGPLRPLPRSLDVVAMRLPAGWNYGHLDYLAEAALGPPFSVPLANPGPNDPIPVDEADPGSRGRALRNRLGVTSVRALERRESEALLAATQQVIDQVTVDQNFTAADICRLQRLWLGEIYEWAGEYRNVNIAKGAFMFAAAAQVPRLMQQLERGPLRLYTPCRFNSTEQQAAALAIVHAELVLIHPFETGTDAAQDYSPC